MHYHLVCHQVLPLEVLYLQDLVRSCYSFSCLILMSKVNFYHIFMCSIKLFTKHNIFQGIVLSYLSIIWTWGGTRLSRRLSRNATKNYSRIKSATMIRRAIVIGVTLNLLGMLVTLIGAEQIIGLLAAKVLTMQGISPFQTSFGLGGVGAAGGLGAQTVQPLDVLIVQANTNTLLSHFMSLVCGLILTRSVHVLDPPSVEDDER